MQVAATVPSSSTAERKRPFWRETLQPYARPHVGRSIADVLTSVVPYLALSVGMYWLLDVSYLLDVVVTEQTPQAM